MNMKIGLGKSGVMNALPANPPALARIASVYVPRMVRVSGKRSEPIKLWHSQQLCESSPFNRRYG